MPRPFPLVLVVAAAGYGKSTALDVAAPRDGLVVSARDALGAQEDLPGHPWLGIDDLHELSPTDQLRLLTAVNALPPDTQVVLTSRHPLSPEVTRILRGRVQRRGPADLALTPYDVHRVLVEEYAVNDPELPVTVHALTGGWPALVHFAAEALAGGTCGDLEAALVGAEAAAAAVWLRGEVLSTLSPGTHQVLACLGDLGPAPGATGVAVADALGLRPDDWRCGELMATGVLQPLHGIGRDGLVQVVPVVAGVARAGQVLPDHAWAAAACILAEQGRPFGAARAAAHAGDWSTACRLLAERGGEMVRQGDAAGLVALVASAPPDSLTHDIRRVHAQALCTRGDLSGAARAYVPLVAAADEPSGPGWSSALACGVGMLAYARGDLEDSLAALDRAPAPDADDQATDVVEVLAWRVHVLCSLGRRDDAVASAADALARAESSGDPVALAAAHLATARVSTGHRREAHHELALQSLQVSGDLVTAARALVNHSCHLLAAARYDEGAHTARAALQAADRGIAGGRRASALHNLAEALVQLGSYDEATWHLDRAIALCRRLGAGRTALGVLGLAEVQRHLGHDEQARARYVEAAELARVAGEPQVLVPALAGLARLPDVVDVEAVDGQDAAQDAADEACRVADGWLRPVALTGAGWVAVRRGERATATALAAAAVAAARDEQANDLLADALELAAACDETQDDAHRHLTEALSVWEAGGALPRVQRVELLLGRLEGADSSARSRARSAARGLQRLGVTHVHGMPVSTRLVGAPVAIEVLGGFRVLVDDAEIPVTAWRSRQARTLVKILAARYGRPASRAWLCETLWPDDDPGRTGHRLSVLLTTVRGVLDPERRWPTDRFVAADLGAVWLEPTYVTVDAETLVRDAKVAAELMDGGDTDRAQEILSDIDGRYRGDAFDDEPAQDWADGVREEVRAAWQQSVRRLAALARRAGRAGEAQSLLVRLLVADPYDDNIHALLVRSLVSAGRRGEARRAFERWQGAMAEIGAPPPDPAVLDTPRRRPAARPAPVALRPVVTPY